MTASKHARAVRLRCGALLAGLLWGVSARVCAEPLRPQEEAAAVVNPSATEAPHDADAVLLPQEAFEARMMTATLLVATGYGTALVTGALAVGSYFAAEKVERWRPGDDWRGSLDVTEDGAINKRDERVFRTSARAFAVLSGIGLCLGIAGSVLLAQALRSAPLQKQDERTRAAPTHARRQNWRYDATLSTRGLGLSFAGRF